MKPKLIARLTITLDHVEPKVTRRLEVPANIRLDRLHLTIQAAMGWSNTHLFDIGTRDVSWGIPDPDFPGGSLDARKTTLTQALSDTGAKTLRYSYDFGDGWEHRIRVGAFFEANPFVQYPVLTGAVGRCPPEDVGGPPGYAEFLEAIADPNHEQHQEMKEWWPMDFDPAEAPAVELAADVAALASRWNRKPRAKRVSKDE